MAEKRRYSRIDVWGAVEMSVDGISYSVDRILDLSLGGCQFPFALDLERGEKCHLRIFLGEGHDGLVIEGHVAWCNGEVVGVAFLEMPYESLEHVKESLILGGVEEEILNVEVELMEESYGLV